MPGARRMGHDQWMAEIFHSWPLRARTRSSALDEFIGRPRYSPLVVLVEATQAMLLRTNTRFGPRSLLTAVAIAMSLGSWWARYSLRVSIPPLSRITASGVSRESAVALSPAAIAA